MPNTTDSPRTRILLVEDEGIIAKDIRRRLEKLGYHVVGIADSGEEALKLAHEHQPELVLMDIVLQGLIDGVETAEQLRQRMDVPVIFLTAHSDVSTIERAKKSQPYGYLIKPFEERELHSSIQMALYRHQAEATQRLQHRAIAASASGIMITDALQPDNPILTCNRAFEQITGYTEAEAVGRNPRFLLGAGTDPEARALLRQAVAAQQDCRVVILNYRKDGTPFWNELAISPVRDATGRVTHFIGVQNDITDRKRAEDALRESHGILQTVIESTPDLIFMKDLEGRYLVVNTAGARVFNRTAAEIIGTGDEAFFPPELARLIRAGDQRLLASGKTEVLELNLPTEGEFRTLHTVKSVCRDAAGKTIGLVGITRNITAQKETERQLRRQASLLQAVNQCAQLLLKHPEWRGILSTFVEKLGRASGLSRCYVFTRPPATDGAEAVALHCDWLADGCAPQKGIQLWRNLGSTRAGLGQWTWMLERGEAVFGHARQMPEAVRAMMGAQSIVSIALLPIRVGNNWWGCLGFDACHEEHEWSDAEREAFRVAADLLGGAIQRAPVLEAFESSPA